MTPTSVFQLICRSLGTVAFLSCCALFCDRAVADDHEPVAISWHAARVHDADFKVVDDTYLITTTGNDPFIQFELPVAKAIGRDWYLSMETFCTEGVASVEGYAGRHPTHDDLVNLPNVDSSEGWTTYHVNLSRLAPAALDPDRPTPFRIDWGMKKGVRLSVRNVRLRPATDQEREQLESESRIRREKELLDEQIDQYIQSPKPVSIERVEHQDQSILIQGHVKPGVATDQLWLVPRRGHEISALPITTKQPSDKYPIDVVNHRFEVQIPAGPNAPLRYPGVRFQVIRKIADQVDLVSAARYPDQLDPELARSLPPVPSLQAAKGLTCLDVRFTSEQIRDLGLQHGSVNVVMNDLIRMTPAPGYEPITIRGREVYYDIHRTRGLDRNIEMLRRADLTVAAILLIPLRSRSGSPIVHPDADPAGVYAMPNLTTGEGVDVFTLTCDFLADRYSQGDNGNGTEPGFVDRRVDHWIVHNEVDAGWSWTNMGEQPMNVFLDHYFRSMRIVDAAVRNRNPHATAFISLTHMWNQGNPKPWRWYPAKSIMEALMAHCETEGDFPWGLAFHPYPESLWEADTWNDNIENDFDAATISIKNIEVLDRFMHTERARRSDGTVRPVLLSEQGFHSPEDRPDSLQIQAAALLYTFEKIRRCPSVVAFDYHRPVDHPNEGGLRLGLRGLPTSEHPIGRAKPGWDVYRAIGTPAEAALREQYEPLYAAP
ncbi:DUF5722 domain-containing protein [Neorhodopirellula pilleata]|uniref:DUF5722 domain-containing protein n=1 Tax=Neorhodopirellula pilleata TaxID=2714738 RepID=A0A5C6AV82_9BACT|nr:DUF5722 domain-containing protein [Neorhodopirellula pilleata]TWU03119.1 hypothetical protein Pla100_00370 [Neorhodopirellula pilleata]